MPASRDVFDLFGDERNADPFRLVILGLTAIEDSLAAALDDSLDGALARELRRMPFKTQVALAIGLGLMPDVFRGPLGRLADLRHQFAHGEIDRLAESHGRQLYASTRELAPDIGLGFPGLTDLEPEIQLITHLAVVDVGMRASFDEARDRRRQQEALQLWWGLRALPGSDARLDKLLREFALDVPPLPPEED